MWLLIVLVFIGWIIAICFEEFRDSVYDILSFVCETFKEIWEDKKIWQSYLLLLVYLLLVLFVIVPFIILSPFLYGVSQLHKKISWYRLLRKQGLTPKAWRLQQEARERERAEKERERTERIEWRDSHIKSFFHPGEAPFSFDWNTFLYLENSCNEELNLCIQQHLKLITEIFQKYGFRFIYLPAWNPDVKNIKLAHLSEKGEERVKGFLNMPDTVEYTRLLCQVLQIDLGEMESGIFHFACHLYEAGERYGTNIEQSKFTHFSMRDVTEDNIEAFCLQYCKMIVESRDNFEGPCFKLHSPAPQLKEKAQKERWFEKKSDISELFDERRELPTPPQKMKDIAENIKKEVNQLKEGGYLELLLHTLGSETLNELYHTKFTPSLSRLEITNDYRIYLTDFGVEVKLTPLQKTIYIFYLRHPEGVEFKMLLEYYDELLSIYKVLSNRENLEKQEESIHRLVDATDNAINEKSSRIKEAFLKVTDDFIARNYYLVLKKEKHMHKGSCYQKLLKQITLPRELVTYPDDIAGINVLKLEDNRNIRI